MNTMTIGYAKFSFGEQDVLQDQLNKEPHDYIMKAQGLIYNIFFLLLIVITCKNGNKK